MFLTFSTILTIMNYMLPCINHYYILNTVYIYISHILAMFCGTKNYLQILRHKNVASRFAKTAHLALRVQHLHIVLRGWHATWGLFFGVKSQRTGWCPPSYTIWL